jgi:methionine sulfoxide reductase heme-binding subunit
MLLPSLHLRAQRARWLKPLVFALCLLPLADLAWRLFFGDGLGANPINTGLRALGLWGLRFLVIGLAVTPLRNVTGWTLLARYRRMIGLFAFFYVSLHLLSYVGVDQGFDWDAIWRDIVKRPYITIGMAGFVLLFPLMVTSFNRMARALGPRRWRALHRSVYAIALLGVLHDFLLVKADIRQPLYYGTLIGLLLAYRFVVWVRARAARAAPPVGGGALRRARIAS